MLCPPGRHDLELAGPRRDARRDLRHQLQHLLQASATPGDPAGVGGVFLCCYYLLSVCLYLLLFICVLLFVCRGGSFFRTEAEGGYKVGASPLRGTPLLRSGHARVCSDGPLQGTPSLRLRFPWLSELSRPKLHSRAPSCGFAPKNVFYLGSRRSACRSSASQVAASSPKNVSRQFGAGSVHVRSDAARPALEAFSPRRLSRNPRRRAPPEGCSSCARRKLSTLVWALGGRNPSEIRSLNKLNLA